MTWMTWATIYVVGIIGTVFIARHNFNTHVSSNYSISRCH